MTYDITAWSIPYAFGLEAYAFTEELPLDDFVYTEDPPQWVLPDESYAYVFPWETFQDAKLLAYLQGAGVKVRVSEKPFTVEGKSFPRGSLIVTTRNNEDLGDALPEILADAAVNTGRFVTEVKSGFVEAGSDFGSGNVHYIPAPKVALLGGDQTSSYSFGETWYFMEQELGYQVTTLDTEYFGRVDLDEYDVLIVPQGYYSLFNESGLSEIKEWVRGGGRLILIGSALRSFAGKEGFSLKKYLTDEEEKEAKQAEEDEKNPLARFADRERARISDAIIGAVFRVRMDPSHPLAYGYDDTYFTLKTSATRYAWLDGGWNVGYLPEGAAAMSGFAGFRAERDMSETLVFGVEDMGSGHVIYMVDNPLFRAFWENGKLLMANAIFMVGH